jgi:heat shock protein HspQ
MASNNQQPTNKMSTISNISLYIPHIFSNFEKDDVVKVFESQKIGIVKNIDFVAKIGKDGKAFNAAYIHFEHWFESKNAFKLQKDIKNVEKQARLTYDKKWFWIILENKTQKYNPGDRKKCINLSGLKEVFEEDDEANMYECELAMLEEDLNLIHIDGRYVQQIEEENNIMREKLNIKPSESVYFNVLTENNKYLEYLAKYNLEDDVDGLNHNLYIMMMNDIENQNYIKKYL